VGVVQVTDTEAATKAFQKIAATPVDFSWAFEDGYALITDDASELDTLMAVDQHLADSPTFSQDRDTLGGDQVALGWADLVDC
jgi:hypothetical protein